MHFRMRKLAANALAATLAAAPAGAVLIPLTEVHLTGQGVGATFTTLFLQGAGCHDGERRRPFQSVSYTHLTLPTTERV